MGKVSIAINGPVSSGKNTVVKILVKQSNYMYCDTDTIYRAIMYPVLQNQIDIQAEESLVTLHVSHTIPFRQTENGQRVFIDDHEVTEAIRQSDITNAVSTVSKRAEVREEVVALQQKIDQAGGAVMDGWGIDITVLPKAGVKIFSVASVEGRAKRRFRENQGKGIETDFEILKAEIERRDYLDSTRKVSPLVQANDAVKIDTAGLTIKEVIAAIQNVIKQKGFELF